MLRIFLVVVGLYLLLHSQLLQAENTPLSLVNESQCRNLAEEAKKFSPSPEILSVTDAKKHAADRFTFLASLGELPETLRWYSLFELHPMNELNLTGVTICGWYKKSYDAKELQPFYGTVAKMAFGGTSVATLENGQSVPLYDASEYGRFYILGNNIGTPQVIANTLVGQEVLELIAKIFFPHSYDDLPAHQQPKPYVNDLELLALSVELFLTLPASHGRTSVLNILKGKSEFKKNSKAFGFVKRHAFFEQRYKDKPLREFLVLVEELLQGMGEKQVSLTEMAAIKAAKATKKDKSDDQDDDDNGKPRYLSSRMDYRYSSEEWRQGIELLLKQRNDIRPDPEDQSATKLILSPKSRRELVLAKLDPESIYAALDQIYKHLSPRENLVFNLSKRIWTESDLVERDGRRVGLKSPYDPKQVKEFRIESRLLSMQIRPSKAQPYNFDLYPLVQARHSPSGELEEVMVYLAIARYKGIRGYNQAANVDYVYVNFNLLDDALSEDALAQIKNALTN